MRPVVLAAAKVACVMAWFAAWWGMYGFTNERCARSERAIEFTPPRSQFPGIIQPWTAPIYLLGGIVLPVLPFIYYWSGRRIRFVLACYAFTSGVAFLCYWIYPMTISRPSFEGSGLGNYLMRQVLTVDGAANCSPSSHVWYAVLSALLVDAARPRQAIRIAVWLLATLVSATTITTGQHYFIDVPTGALAAILGFTVVRRLFPVDSGGEVSR